MWQLWPTTARFCCQYVKVLYTLKKKVRSVYKKSKRFFINTIMSKWTRSGACARDPQYQPKVNCNPICCVCVCWQSAGDPNKTYNLLSDMKSIKCVGCSSRTKFFMPQASLHYLVMRDIDRYRHLISAGPMCWALAVGVTGACCCWSPALLGSS